MTIDCINIGGGGDGKLSDRPVHRDVLGMEFRCVNFAGFSWGHIFPLTYKHGRKNSSGKIRDNMPDGRNHRRTLILPKVSNTATVKRGFWKRDNCVKFGFLALTFLSSCHLWRLFGHLCASVTPKTDPCCTTQASKTQRLSTPQRGLCSAEICGTFSAKCGNCRKLCFSHPGHQAL